MIFCIQHVYRNILKIQLHNERFLCENVELVLSN